MSNTLQVEFYLLEQIGAFIIATVNEAKLYVADQLLNTPLGVAKPTGFDDASITQIKSLSNVQVFTDPDVEWDTVIDDSSGGVIRKKSTPVVLIELESVNPTKSSVTGVMINGEIDYNVVVYVDKSNSKYSVYKPEVVFLSNAVRKIFSLHSELRLLTGKALYNDFELSKTNFVSGALIPVQATINNFSYSLS